MAFFEHPLGAMHQAGFLMSMDLPNPHTNAVSIGEVTCPRFPSWEVAELGFELSSKAQTLHQDTRYFCCCLFCNSLNYEGPFWKHMIDVNLGQCFIP